MKSQLLRFFHLSVTVTIKDILSIFNIVYLSIVSKFEIERIHLEFSGTSRKLKSEKCQNALTKLSNGAYVCSKRYFTSLAYPT